MSSIDDIIHSVLVSDTGATETDKSKTLPDYPGETPSKSELLDWVV